MDILFLTLIDFASIEENNIYTDLMREFVKGSHTVYIVSPTERRKREPTHLIDSESSKILKIQIGNTQKTNLIEKGISTIMLESKFTRGIKKYFREIRFDLIIYSTPPITLLSPVEYVRKRDQAASYLLLKDIFPQNAVDLGLLRTTGLKGLLYRYFRSKEKRLYAKSDYIGCMSDANVDFLLRHNPFIPSEKVEVCPNSIEPLVIEKNPACCLEIKNRYKIPLDKTVFIYGGNLGKPQGVDFLIECLKSNEGNEQAFFVIAGSGTEYDKIKNHFEENHPKNAILLSQLSKQDYDILASSCDVGLIFLDKRFTIPNFPSRLLSYMQASMPVLAATDIHTDIGKIMEAGGFGLWCESRDVHEFNRKLSQLLDPMNREKMGQNARQYLENHYTAKHSYEIMMKHFEKI